MQRLQAIHTRYGDFQVQIHIETKIAMRQPFKTNIEKIIPQRFKSTLKMSKSFGRLFKLCWTTSKKSNKHFLAVKYIIY